VFTVKVVGGKGETPAEEREECEHYEKNENEPVQATLDHRELI